MTQVVFVRTRHHYVPYDDFFRLAELSGYPIIYIDEMLQHDSRDTTFIISPVNGEWNTRPKGYTQGRVILYMLEWNTDGEHNDPPCADEIWCGDEWHARIHNYRYVPIGSHPGLSLQPMRLYLFDYDLAFMGYAAPPRRAKVLHELYESGLRIAPNGWGLNRSIALDGSKCMVAIHQFDNMPTIAPLRMCIAAAHRLAVISETVESPAVFDGLIESIPYDTLAHTAQLIIRNPHNRLLEMGDNLYHYLCEVMPFRKSIDGAL